MTPVKSHGSRLTVSLRRALVVVAVAAIAVSGWQLINTVSSGVGVLGLPGATADPTGPPGPTGDPSGANGGQFQPPAPPAQMPDYRGGINQPPLDQNNGISIYNTGAQGAPQQPDQQGAQQGDRGQQPQHGTQIPDYQSATPYTQGPGQANPDHQAPQQGNPPQQDQPQQGQQNRPQNRQDQDTRQFDQQQRQQQCESAAQYYGILEQLRSFVASALGGAGSVFQQPSRKFTPADQCNCAPRQGGPQKQSPETGDSQTPPTDETRQNKCPETGPDGMVNLPSLESLNKGSEYHLKPNAANIARVVANLFPDVPKIGGWRPPDPPYNEHVSGRATDIMTYENMQLGQKIADYLVANSQCFSIQWVIFNQKIWNASTGKWSPMDDRGSPTANHMDHVHVNSL
ncbi:hypothetical protein [Mycobacteroides saopaulense]|uniref:hypothetical protein n=1 Tax=Mycobacteroides saopaulense TaxID=1578165 RepID=UPI0010545381